MDDEKRLGIILAQNIQYYLDREKMNRKELANRLNVSVSSVGFWLTGSKIPRSDKIDAMCKIFDCSRKDLLLEHTEHNRLPLSQEERIMKYALKIAGLSQNSRDLVYQFIDFQIAQEKGSDNAPTE